MHDFNELSVFAAVVEQGGLTAVSLSMSLPKSTLSRRISQLEARVGQRLLLRQSNRMIPTEAGKLFYSYCRQLLDLADQSQQSLDALQDEVSGQLTLRVHNAYERGWLPAVLDAFLDHYPGVRLELLTGTPPPAYQENSIGDLWLWLGMDTVNGLRCEKIGQWRTGLYASPGYLEQHGMPQHPRQLSLHRWVDVLEGDGRTVPLHSPAQAEYLFTPTPSRLKVDTLVLQADSLVRGQGIGVLPIWYAERYEQAHPGSFLRCLDEWAPPSLPVSLLYSFGRAPRKVTALIDWLRQSMPESWHV